MLCAGLLGCASHEISQTDPYARINWQISFAPRYIELRQLPVPIPTEYGQVQDEIQSQVMKHGFITGWDFMIGGHPGALAPRTIIGDRSLADAWYAAYATGASNAVEFITKEWNGKSSNNDIQPAK